MLYASGILTGFESGLLYTTLLVFGGASVVGVRVVAGRRRGRGLRVLLALGVAALTLFLVASSVREGHLPLVHRREVLLLAAWSMGVGAWAVSRRLDLPVLAAVAAPTLTLLVFFGLLLVPPEGGAPDLGAGKVLHVVLAVLGFAGFTVSAGVGVLYLRQIRVLKRDPLAAVAGRMPSLERLDGLNFAAALFGFPCLALSMVAGWLFLATSAGWFLDPTVLTSFGGLLVYTLLFTARGFLGWHGRRIAWLSVAGLVVAGVGDVVAPLCTSPSTIHGA